MSPEFFAVYLVTILVASIIPGPSMLLALTHGMKYGTRRTIASALGNLAVTLLQAGVSIAGLGTILLASENLFNIIRWIGAAYLIYMGIVMWNSPDIAVPDGLSCKPSAEVSLKRMFLQGAFVTAGNPKAIIFFTAVFPQFIDPGRSGVTQIAVFLATAGVVAFGCFMVYAVCGQRIIVLFRGASKGRAINRAFGGAFIGSGIGLAVTRR